MSTRRTFIFAANHRQGEIQKDYLKAGRYKHFGEKVMEQVDHRFIIITRLEHLRGHSIDPSDCIFIDNFHLNPECQEIINYLQYAVHLNIGSGK